MPIMTDRENQFTDDEGRNHDHRLGSLCDPCMDDLDVEAVEPVQHTGEER